MWHDVENDVKIARRSLEALSKAGADKAQTSLAVSEKHEMNIDAGELSLLRTTFNTSLHLTAIKQSRRGNIGLNRSDDASVDKAVAEVMDITSGSQPDEANDIAEYQEPTEFHKGPDSPDLDTMFDRLKSFAAAVRQRYPKALLRQVILSFTRSRALVMNSNGVDFRTFKGIYQMYAMFSSADGKKVSSFNGSFASMLDLDRELIDCGSLDMLIRQSEDQIETRPIKGKFVGDVVVTPDCFFDVWGFLMSMISDAAIISGTSIYKDSVGHQIASPLVTIHSRPVSVEIADGYFVTGDGYAAKNSTIVDHGVLQDLLLSLYGSRKTGRRRAVNAGGAIVAEAGDRSLDDLIRSVKRGVLMSRFSGGSPSNSGDFSGVAKNSYLIEDGEIRYPISESMISGNLAEAYKSITGVSRERIDYGTAVVPWMVASGLTISGK